MNLTWQCLSFYRLNRSASSPTHRCTGRIEVDGELKSLVESGKLCRYTFPHLESCMNRKRISSGSKFETDIGYSRAVIDGDYIFLSGTK